jgi:hypothetical protein
MIYYGRQDCRNGYRIYPLRFFRRLPLPKPDVHFEIILWRDITIQMSMRLTSLVALPYSHCLAKHARHCSVGIWNRYIIVIPLHHNDDMYHSTLFSVSISFSVANGNPWIDSS